MKKIISVISAAVIALSLFGCSAKTSNDLSNSTVAGKVTAISGSSIILLLGELTESNTGTAPSDATSGDTKSGTAPSGAPSGDGNAPSGGGNAPVGGGNALGSGSSFQQVRRA